MKTCIGCQRELALEHFSPHSRGRQGVSPRCKDCLRPVKRESARRWRERNVDRARANSLRWRRENLERARATSNQWFKDHPEEACAHQRRRRLGVAADYAEVLRQDPCSYCVDAGTTIDHIDPLARGGTSDDWQNLTAACPSCNASKQDKPLLIYLGGR